MINYFFENFAKQSCRTDKSLWYKFADLGVLNGGDL